MWEEDNMDNFKKNALDICREFLTGPWKDLQLENFRLTKISGGCSNKLYLCSSNKLWHDDEEIPRQVMIRIRGPIARAFEDIIQDAAVSTLLAERNLGPKIYGFFENGRLEEYIPSVSMKLEDVAEMFLPLARELAKIHALRVPMRKSPKKLHDITIEWLDDLEANAHMIPDGPAINSTLKNMIVSGELRKDFEWSFGLIEKLDSPPVVFCHNDLHGGNFLLRKDVPQGSDVSPVLIIDFEFAFYNHRSFDIAGMFVSRCLEVDKEEYPHYEFDIQRYPSKEEQESLLDAYLDQMSKEVSLPENFCMEQEKQKILEEVEVFRIYGGFTPAIWAFKMLVSPGHQRFKFGFVEIGFSFLEYFKKFKAKYLEENEFTQ